MSQVTTNVVPAPIRITAPPGYDRTIFYVLIIAIAVIIIAWLVIWLLSAKPAIGCTSDQQCSYDQQCSAAVCVPRTCGPGITLTSTSSDCPGSQVCLSGQCHVKHCLNTSECDTGEICNNIGVSTNGQRTSGICVPNGNACSNNIDCYNVSLYCLSGTCQQCSSTNPCPAGGVCNNGVCERCNSGNACPANNVCVANDAEGGGCCSIADVVPPASSTTNAILPRNSSTARVPVAILASSRALLPLTSGPSNNGTVSNANRLQSNCNAICSSSSDCQGNCPNCVNSRCSCLTGVTRDRCTTDSDCGSNICLRNTLFGDVCGFPGASATSCITSYSSDVSPSGLGNNGVCPRNSPYCVSGTCSTSFIGSQCGSNNECGSGFCINNLCQATAGLPGEICYGSSSCITGLQCINNRCVVG